MKQVFYILIFIFTFTSLYAETKIEFMLGDVRIQPQGSSSWQNAENGRVIRVGDTMQTGKKSFATINADGNSIKIQANTKVKFTQDFIDNRQQSSLALFGGSVNCKMDRLKKNNSGYNVSTASSVCAVRGTEFDVAASPDGKTILQVTDGTVALSGTSKSVDVSKDHESSVKIGGEPEPVKIIKRQDWEKWAEETTGDVKGKEKDIIAGCLVKMQKLDADIKQLEKEGAAAETIAGENYKLAMEAKDAKDMKKASEYMKIYQTQHMKAYSSNITASYQTMRIELVREVSDNAYNSIQNKKSIKKQYDTIVQIRNKNYNKYIKQTTNKK